MISKIITSIIKIDVKLQILYERKIFFKKRYIFSNKQIKAISVLQAGCVEQNN
jgi:hypothetical protein